MASLHAVPRVATSNLGAEFLSNILQLKLFCDYKSLLVPMGWIWYFVVSATPKLRGEGSLLLYT